MGKGNGRGRGATFIYGVLHLLTSLLQLGVLVYFCVIIPKYYSNSIIAHDSEVALFGCYLLIAATVLGIGAWFLFVAAVQQDSRSLLLIWIVLELVIIGMTIVGAVLYIGSGGNVVSYFFLGFILIFCFYALYQVWMIWEYRKQLFEAQGQGQDEEQEDNEDDD